MIDSRALLIIKSWKYSPLSSAALLNRALFLSTDKTVACPRSGVSLFHGLTSMESREGDSKGFNHPRHWNNKMPKRQGRWKSIFSVGFQA
jgi:hypothetical protein